MSDPVTYFVLLHSPGPRWQAGIGFRHQDGVGRHVRYMREQLEGGRLILGGPFLDDSGGLMVLRASTLEEARAIALADSTVVDGLLQVDVRPWMVVMDGLSRG